MRALACAALCAICAQAVHAQGRAEGRIIRLSGADTVAVASAEVVLHRVGPRRQGPLDTAVTDARGGFRFRFAPDSGAAFLLSARYAGIEYFSRPISADPALPDTAVTLIVADTSSAQPVTVRQRTLLVSRADESGTRIVIDWLVLGNRGPLTRVSPDSTRPSWGGPLPEAAQSVEMADSPLSQFAAEALAFRGDSVLIFAPLSPGDKELMLQYRIPGEIGRFVVPAVVDDSVFVLLEEDGARVVTPALVAADSQMIEGRAFRRFAGTMAGATTLEIALAGRRLSSQQLLVILVALLATGFALLAWRLLRKRRPVSAPGPANPGALAAAIARLDARHAGRQQEVDASEWDGYQSERARLKEQLERALAMRPPRS